MPPRRADGGEGGDGDNGARGAEPQNQPQLQDDLLPAAPATSAASFSTRSDAPPTYEDKSATASSRTSLDKEQQQHALLPLPEDPSKQPPEHSSRPPAFLPSPPYSSFTLNLIAGGGAGVVETILTYPLDLVRTRFQMMRGIDTAGRSSSSSTTSLPRTPRASSTVVGMLVQITREEGFLRLYRGLLPPLLSEVPRRALKFSANDFYKQQLQSSSSSKVSITQATLAGTLTGLTETIFHTPFELLKVRLQTKEFAHCPNTYACALEVWEKEGGGGGREGGRGGRGERLRAFYKGWEAYLWRQGIWNGCFFGSIAVIREYFPPSPPPPLPPPELLSPVSAAAPPSSSASSSRSSSRSNSSSSSSSNSSSSSSSSSRSSSSSSSSSSNTSRRSYDFGTGLIAGCVATVVNTPFDVCKTRLQCMTEMSGGGGGGGGRERGREGGGSGVNSSGGGGGGGRGGRVSLPWVLPFLRQLYQEEGFRACFKGLNARLYRAGPGSGVLLVAYEGIVKMLSSDKG